VRMVEGFPALTNVVPGPLDGEGIAWNPIG
jgi:hypothetical protein